MRKKRKKSENHYFCKCVWTVWITEKHKLSLLKPRSVTYCIIIFPKALKNLVAARKSTWLIRCSADKQLADREVDCESNIFQFQSRVEHVTCYDMWYSTSLVTVEMHLETGLHFGPSWIRRIWRSFLVRWISNFGTVNFGTPQHSRNHSNHSFNRLTIVSKVVITFRISKNHVSIIGTVKGQ